MKDTAWVSLQALSFLSRKAKSENKQDKYLTCKLCQSKNRIVICTCLLVYCKNKCEFGRVKSSHKTNKYSWMHMQYVPD